MITIRELRDLLDDLANDGHEDTEVRIAHQPHYPFEYSIDDAPDGPRIPKIKGVPIFYLAEGRQIGYLPSKAAVAVGWAEAEPGECENCSDPDCDGCCPACRQEDCADPDCTGRKAVRS